MTKGTPQITFRNIEPSGAITERIHSEVDKLERLSGSITGCKVLVEVPHRHQKHGEPFHVRIEVTLPGHELIIHHGARPHNGLNTVGEEHGRFKDLHLTITEAFKAARRRVEDCTRKVRGDVKWHSRLNPARDEKVAC